MDITRLGLSQSKKLIKAGVRGWSLEAWFGEDVETSDTKQNKSVWLEGLPGYITYSSELGSKENP